MVRRVLARFAVAHADELRQHVARHPLAAVCVAFAAGLVVARGEHSSRFVRRQTLDVVVAAVGTALFGLAKDAAVRAGRDWIDERRHAVH
jgi:hypothetical protein